MCVCDHTGHRSKCGLGQHIKEREVREKKKKKIRNKKESYIIYDYACCAVILSFSRKCPTTHSSVEFSFRCFFFPVVFLFVLLSIFLVLLPFISAIGVRRLGFSSSRLQWSPSGKLLCSARLLPRITVYVTVLFYFFFLSYLHRLVNSILISLVVGRLVAQLHSNRHDVVYK